MVSTPEERASGDREGAGNAPPEGRDPRQIVSPYAFRVADELMGAPLASPWRRAAAMLVDLAAVLGVVLLREVTGPLFLVLLAWLAFRATTHRARRPVRRTLPRIGLRTAAVLLLLTGTGQGIDRVLEARRSPDGGSGTASTAADSLARRWAAAA